MKVRLDILKSLLKASRLEFDESSLKMNGSTAEAVMSDGSKATYDDETLVFRPVKAAEYIKINYTLFKDGVSFKDVIGD